MALLPFLVGSISIRLAAHGPHLTARTNNFQHTYLPAIPKLPWQEEDMRQEQRERLGGYIFVARLLTVSSQ
jgi:hypothetical protein